MARANTRRAANQLPTRTVGHSSKSESKAGTQLPYSSGVLSGAKTGTAVATCCVMPLLQRLNRYSDFARFLGKYGHVDLMQQDPHDGPEHAANESRHDAETFVRDIEALGPTFIKLGQLLSTRADLFPPTYLDALSRLQDDVAPFPYEDVVRIVQEELGVRLSKAFVAFDETPIAAASLGQVHRAVLRSGREVAVKVQRPDVRQQVLQDLEALDDIAALLERFSAAVRVLDVPRLLDEFRRTMMRELDYHQEARNMVALASQLRRFPRIVVPLPVDDYTASRVLTMDYIRGKKITQINPVEWTEIDAVGLAHELFRVYLHQILVAGFFHADPHPGNVLLTADHRLSLIDLGMVGRVSNTVQEQLFRLLLALADGRGDDAATVVLSIGEKLDAFDEAHMRRIIAEMVGRYQNASTKELNVGRVMLELTRSGSRFGVRMPPELALLGKTLLNLHEIGRVLDSDFDVNRSMRRNASSLMRRRVLKIATPTHMLASALEFRALVQRLPDRLNRILEALAANDLRLKVEMIDHGSIIDGLQKVANRIALGLVLAALIVGAAMLMQVPTSFTLFGYPGLAILLFLSAAAGGMWLAWTIIAGDVRKTTLPS
jgi:ubiquinone biosynthesis protein